MYPFSGVAITTSSSVSSFDNSLVDFCFETLVFLISNFFINQITSCFSYFLNCSFGWCFYCTCSIYFQHYQEVFDHTYYLNVLIFFAKDKNPYPFTHVLSLVSIEYLIFIRYLYLINIV